MGLHVVGDLAQPLGYGITTVEVSEEGLGVATARSLKGSDKRGGVTFGKSDKIQPVGFNVSGTQHVVPLPT